MSNSWFAFKSKCCFRNLSNNSNYYWLIRAKFFRLKLLKYNLKTDMT